MHWPCMVFYNCGGGHRCESNRASELVNSLGQWQLLCSCSMQPTPVTMPRTSLQWCSQHARTKDRSCNKDQSRGTCCNSCAHSLNLCLQVAGRKLSVARTILSTKHISNPYFPLIQHATYLLSILKMPWKLCSTTLLVLNSTREKKFL